MNDDIAAIQQDPIPLGEAFGSDLDSLSLQLLRQVSGNRRDMPIGATARHNHMVGDQGFSVEVDGGGVDGLIVVEGREDHVQDLAITEVGPGRRSGARYRMASGRDANIVNI